MAMHFVNVLKIIKLHIEKQVNLMVDKLYLNKAVSKNKNDWGVDRLKCGKANIKKC